MPTANTPRSLATAFSMALAFFSLPAAAVNKCTAPDGAVIFQDAACPGKGEALVVRPASGPGRQAAPAGVSEAQRINAATDRSAAARRIIDLDAMLIPRAVQALQRHQLRCEQQRAELERSQYAYLQNLYGKTHAAQIASEVVQLTLDCEREEKALQGSLLHLQDERRRAVEAAGAGPR